MNADITVADNLYVQSAILFFESNGTVYKAKLIA